MSEQPPQVVDPAREIAFLHARIADLEAELADTHRRANAAIAAAQDHAYWLDRWHVDVNTLVELPGAGMLRRALRAVRGLVRKLRKLLG